MNQNQSNTNTTPDKEKKGPKFNIYWIYGLIAVVLLGAQFYKGFGAEGSTIYQQCIFKIFL